MKRIFLPFCALAFFPGAQLRRLTGTNSRAQQENRRIAWVTP